MQGGKVAYLRGLQTADDVEGRVRMLVHLEEEGAGQEITERDVLL